MRRFIGCLILILGLTGSVQSADAQHGSATMEHWHTGGVGLSTPMGFNLGLSYSLVVKRPLFVQVRGGTSHDPYITRHSVYAAGPALGVRRYTDVALLALSAGPTYLRGTRGADLLAPGMPYEALGVTVTAQLLFRETNIGVELYTLPNTVRNVSGIRLIYRLGSIR